MLENIGTNLRRIRRARDLTQAQVAQFAGCRQQLISAIERGLRPRAELIDRLARAVGAHPNALLAPQKGESPDSAGNTTAVPIDRGGV